MVLTPGERIDLIRECATVLDKQDWADIDLVLDQHGMPTSDYAPDTRYAYVQQMIKTSDDAELRQLHDYLTREGHPARPGQSPWSGNRLRLFCSHLATQKDFVSSVGEVLERYSIEPFIAHDAIEPTKEWQDVIEAALADCDALVAFLHPGFRESEWCDAEVGWALGRKRPMLVLNFGVEPYGFLGKFQHQPCADASARQIGGYVMDWLSKTPSLHGRLGPGLVDAFVSSGSWNFTRSVVPYLGRIESVSDDDLARMEAAAEDNIDVRECGIGDRSGPEWVADFVAKRRGPTEAPTWPDDTDVAIQDAGYPEEPPF